MKIVPTPNLRCETTTTTTTTTTNNNNNRPQHCKSAKTFRKILEIGETRCQSNLSEKPSQ